MSFATANKKKEDLKQSGGAYISTSGIYLVNIIAPFVSISKGGSVSVDLFIEHEKQKQVIYGNMRIKNNDGTPNPIGSKVFNQLIIMADVDEVAEPIEAELPIGKAEAMKDCSVLEDLCDIDIFMRVQMEYSAHNGNIQEKTVIKGFYRAEDKATAEEVVNGENVGSGHDKDQKYIDNVTYKDGVTPEQIELWISDKRPKGTAGNTPSYSEDKPKFGKKRAFGS